MKILRIGLILGLILSLFAFSVPAAAAGTTSGGYGTDRIIVKYLENEDAIDARNLRISNGDVLEVAIPELGVEVIKVPADRVGERIVAYRAQSGVEYAEPDYILNAIGTPSDPYYSNEWGLAKIQASQAWNTTQGSASVKIAILDTGIDQNHPDLAAKIVSNKNYTTSASADDLYGHGTHVAGIAAAITNNGVGVAGVGYNCAIMNVKVLGDTGGGYTSWVASGITWAADNGAKVINMSLGGGSPTSTLQNAINYAWGKGVVVVAAAGNDGVSTPCYPAHYSNCIAVAATGQSDTKASFSNYGTWVDVAAPGVGIYSTLPNHSNVIGGSGSATYGSLSGTSMATPFVAGLAGLVWATPYGTSASSVRSRIESTADTISGTGTNWEHGRINAYDAVGTAGGSPPAITVTSPNGGESWAAGASRSITWSSSNVTGNVNILLSRNNGGSWTTIVSNTANDGSQSWTVTSPATTQALVRVESASSSSVFDNSNSSFSITETATASITVTSPNGGESWRRGTSHGITWNSTGLTGYVRIELLKGSSVVRTISSSTSVASGSRTWTISSSQATGTDYRIRITSTSSTSVSDVSNGYFSITSTSTPPTTTPPSSSITVTSPNGGESWAAGASRNITWNSSNVTGNVNIQLSRNGGSTWTTIISGTANDGSQSWTVSGAATTQARIRVVSANNSSISDSSNSNFTISSTPSSTNIYVKAITMTLEPRTINGSPYVGAVATVTVVNASGGAVSGATVYGVWSDTTKDSDSGATSSTGKVSLKSNLVAQAAGKKFTFTVTNIVLDGYTYNPGANVISSNSITTS